MSKFGAIGLRPCKRAVNTTRKPSRGLLWPGPLLFTKKGAPLCTYALAPFRIIFFIDKRSPILLVYAVVPSPSRFSKTWHTMFLTYSLASFPVFLHRKNQRDKSQALVPKIVGCSSSPTEKGRKPKTKGTRVCDCVCLEESWSMLKLQILPTRLRDLSDFWRTRTRARGRGTAG